MVCNKVLHTVLEDLHILDQNKSTGGSTYIEAKSRCPRIDFKVPVRDIETIKQSQINHHNCDCHCPETPSGSTRNLCLLIEHSYNEVTATKQTFLEPEVRVNSW